VEAAATSHSANFDDYGYGGTENPYTGYSAESHGTYGQPAMSHGRESYVMRDVGGHDNAAGAAGIGAARGAAAMQRARSRKEAASVASAPASGESGGDYQERTPYPAFAGPGPQPHEMYDQSGVPGLRYRRTPGGPEPDLLEAAGLGASAPTAGAAVGAGAGAAYMNRQPSGRPRHTANRSQGSFGRISDGLGYSSSSPPPPNESYAAHYQRGFRPDAAQQQQQPQQANAGRASGGFSDEHGPEPAQDPFQNPTAVTSPALPNPHDPYEAYADDAMGQGPGSDEGGGGGQFMGHTDRGEEGRLSFQDEEDYGRQPRVLKVANE